MKRRCNSALLVILFIVSVFSNAAAAGSSTISDGFLHIPRVDVFGFGSYQLVLRIEFNREFQFVLLEANEASLNVDSSGVYDPVIHTLDVDEIALDTGQRYAAQFILMPDPNRVVFRLSDAVLLNPNDTFTGDGGSGDGESDSNGNDNENSNGDSADSGDESGDSNDETGNSNSDDSNTDVSDVFARNGCTAGGCHSAVPGPNGLNLETGSDLDFSNRMVDVLSANSTCRGAGQRLIDSNDPSSSLLITLTDPSSGVQCMSKMPLGMDGISDPQDRALLADWVDQLIQLAPSEGNGTADSGNDGSTVDYQLIPIGDPVRVAQKIKMLINGGALTEDELASLQTSINMEQVEVEEIDALIANWMNTPGFDTKMLDFFEAALAQGGGLEEYRQQIGTPPHNNRLVWTRMVRESMPRTALRIVNADQDFREIVTTNEWEVTTLLLAALAWADDSSRRTFGPGYNGALRLDSHPLDPGVLRTDYSDWRTVTLDTIAPDTDGRVRSPYAYTDAASQSNDRDMKEAEVFAWLEQFRAVPDGGSVDLVRPAIGFFNSLAFHEQWLTNQDNQYRNVVNQTLIAALGLTFETGDATPLADDIEVDPDHAPTNSVCYGCHKNLDPMRNVFVKYYEPHKVRVEQHQLDESYRLRLSSYDPDADNRLPQRERALLEMEQAGVMQGLSEHLRNSMRTFRRMSVTVFQQRPGEPYSIRITGPSMQFASRFFDPYDLSEYRTDQASNRAALEDLLDAQFANPGNTADDEDVIEQIVAAFGHDLLKFPARFSFHGHQRSIDDMQSFANAIASHPNFARAWTLKLCQWMTSTSCSSVSGELQDEIDRIAMEFQNSNHNFKDLIRHLATSKLITHSVLDETLDLAPGSIISIARRDHLCAAIQSRIAQARDGKAYSDPADEASFAEFCKISEMRDYHQRRPMHSAISVYPEEGVLRGAIEFAQESDSSLLQAQSLDVICDQMGRYVVGNSTNNTLAYNNAGAIEESMEDLTRYFAGVPSNSPEYDSALGHINRLYEIGRAPMCSNSESARGEWQTTFDNLAAPVQCGLGLNAQQSMRMAWNAVCKLPEMSAIGL